jgi:O-6-methylguanine DNA methyltransferase
MSTPACLHLQRLSSPLGGLLAVADEDAIVLLEFDEAPRATLQLQRLCRQLRTTTAERVHPLLTRLQQELSAYFAGELRHFSLPLRYPGTAFQQQAWDALHGIPYGQTRSYAQQAALLGRADAVRAVGTCNGLNRIAILVPCHRLVTSAGTLGGYGGGLWRKQRLIDLEAGIRPDAGRRPPAVPRR